MTLVQIGRNVQPEELEKALLEAAKRVGLRADSKDEYSTEYRLGSVQEAQKYERTHVRLRGRFLPALHVTYVNGGKVGWLLNRDCNWFSVEADFASKKKVERYLSAVSDALKPAG